MGNCKEECTDIEPYSNENLKEYSHCTEIDNLYIYVESNTHYLNNKDSGFITDLTPLKNLKKVNESIYIGDMPGLKSLEGLQNIKEIREFYIVDTPDFTGDTTALGFSSIEHLELSYHESTSKISTLKFLKNLEQVTRNLVIENIPVLDFDGLASIKQISNFEYLDGEANDISQLEGVVFSGDISFGRYENLTCDENFIPLFNSLNFSRVDLSEGSSISALLNFCGFSVP